MDTSTRNTEAGSGARRRLPPVWTRLIVPLAVLASFVILVLARAGMACGQGRGAGVLGYHGAGDRSGQYVVPGLTFAKAAKLRRDAGFDGRIEGHVYAQPLYWHPPGAASALVVAVTESNTVYALDATTGRIVWRRALGEPATREMLPCGNIDPLGITGTPVIDPASGTLYLDAMVAEHGALKHLVYGLSMRDGRVLPGWPVDIAAGLKARGMSFDARVQNQRAALALARGRLFVPYGGHTGDCGNYRGWVVGVQIDKPGVAGAWQTRGVKGGIWAPGGVAVVGDRLFVTTGNTHGARTWSDGEAVIRLTPELGRVDDPRDFFSPGNWRQLDEDDLDLGGANALPVDLRGRRLMVALGKDGKAYLLDRENLGGIGGALDVREVSRTPIVGAPAAWTTPDAAFVAFRDLRASPPCRGSGGNSGLSVLRIDSAGKGGIKPAWCRRLDGGGSPVTTTSDGRADRIVWIVGAEGDDRLHGFRADDGEPVFDGGRDSDRMEGLRHFATVAAGNERLYVAADDRIYAFAPAP